MHGTTASIRPPGRLSGTEVARAELDSAWRPWVRLLDVALAAADDTAWARAVPELASDHPAGAPLLHGASVRVDAVRARQLVRALLTEARRGYPDGHAETREPRYARRRRLDVTDLVHGALVQDVESIERVAEAAELDVGRLAAVAQLAVIPLLRACATAWRDRIPESWLHGYCPVCGAWAALAELRGLERNRRLRCGRCSADWPLPVLRCPYCDELHHDKLHALLPEGDEQTRRVDVCDSCQGYLKSFSTLRPMSLEAVAIMDLSTIALDLVAQDRGYARPSRLAYQVVASVRRSEV